MPLSSPFFLIFCLFIVYCSLLGQLWTHFAVHFSIIFSILHPFDWRIVLRSLQRSEKIAIFGAAKLAAQVKTHTKSWIRHPRTFNFIKISLTLKLGSTLFSFSQLCIRHLFFTFLCNCLNLTSTLYLGERVTWKCSCVSFDWFPQKDFMRHIFWSHAGKKMHCKFSFLLKTGQIICQFFGKFTLAKARLSHFWILFLCIFCLLLVLYLLTSGLFGPFVSFDRFPQKDFMRHIFFVSHAGKKYAE